MRVGIVSDTHDRLEAIELAVARFNDIGVKHVFHAGDLISPFTASVFKSLKAELHIVWGNNDGDKPLLTEKFRGIAKIYGNFMDIELNGRRIAMLHGVNEGIVKALAKCGEYSLIIRGHTHKPEIRRESKTLIVNPGAASGYLTEKKTIAIVNLETMEAELLTLE